MRSRSRNAPPDDETDGRATTIAASGETAPASAAGNAVDFLHRIVELLPDAEAFAWRAIVERFEAGQSFEEAAGLPSDWRVRERNRQLRRLASFGLSGADGERELRRNARSRFPALIGTIIRLSNGQILCARSIRRIVR
jgi:hypothetical protein